MPPTRSLSIFLFVLVLFIFPVIALAGDPSGPLAGKGRFVIDSDTMEALGDGKIIIFKGRVSARDDFILCSDELRITYNDANEIKEIVALGSVRLFQGGRIATAGKAEFDREKRTIVFLGEPRISQCGDVVSGNRIIYNMDTESAVVEGGEGARVRAVMISEKKCVEEEIVEEDFCEWAR